MTVLGPDEMADSWCIADRRRTFPIEFSWSEKVDNRPDSASAHRLDAVIVARRKRHA
jgi:hypothetical protein